MSLQKVVANAVYLTWTGVMSCFFAFLLTLLILGVSHMVFGSEMPQSPHGGQAPVGPDEHGNVVNVQMPTLPAIEVTLVEVLQIISDYEVVHEGRLMTYFKYYGLTDPNAKTIYINSGVSQDFRVETVIHEIIHVIYARRGYDTRGAFYEPIVEAKAQEVYTQLYGGTK